MPNGRAWVGIRKRHADTARLDDGGTVPSAVPPGLRRSRRDVRISSPIPRDRRTARASSKCRVRRTSAADNARGITRLSGPRGCSTSSLNDRLIITRRCGAPTYPRPPVIRRLSTPRTRPVLPDASTAQRPSATSLAPPLSTERAYRTSLVRRWKRAPNGISLRLLAIASGGLGANGTYTGDPRPGLTVRGIFVGRSSSEEDCHGLVSGGSSCCRRRR